MLGLSVKERTQIVVMVEIVTDECSLFNHRLKFVIAEGLDLGNRYGKGEGFLGLEISEAVLEVGSEIAKQKFRARCFVVDDGDRDRRRVFDECGVWRIS